MAYRKIQDHASLRDSTKWSRSSLVAADDRQTSRAWRFLAFRRLQVSPHRVIYHFVGGPQLSCTTRQPLNRGPSRHTKANIQSRSQPHVYRYLVTEAKVLKAPSKASHVTLSVVRIGLLLTEQDIEVDITVNDHCCRITYSTQRCYVPIMDGAKVTPS